MLVLTRKVNESVSIAHGEIIVTLLEIRGNKVRLSFDAPLDIPINRAEIQQRIDRQQKKSNVPPEQALLRTFNEEQRLDWFDRYTTWKRALGMFVIRIDGFLAAMGTSEEQDVMFKRFCEVIDGPEIKPRVGGMG